MFLFCFFTVAPTKNKNTYRERTTIKIDIYFKKCKVNICMCTGKSIILQMCIYRKRKRLSVYFLVLPNCSHAHSFFCRLDNKPVMNIFNQSQWTLSICIHLPLVTPQKPHLNTPSDICPLAGSPWQPVQIDRWEHLAVVILLFCSEASCNRKQFWKIVKDLYYLDFTAKIKSLHHGEIYFE